MSSASKPYNLVWPFSAPQLENIDKMFQQLYKKLASAGASPTTTLGDLIYNSGTADTRLAIGANHTILNSNGSVPSWGLLDLANSVTGLLNIASYVSGILAVANGGTGKNNSAVTDGQLLIGKTSDHSFSRAAITAGSGITITNGPGTIQIDAGGSSGSVTAPLIEIAADTTLAAMSGAMVPDSMEIDAGFKYEITGGARQEIHARPLGTPFMTQTVLNNSQILRLDTVPWVVVPSPGAGYMNILLAMTVRMTQNSGYNTTQSLRLRYHGNTNDIITVASVINTAAQDQVFRFNPIDQNKTFAIASSALEITHSGGIVGAAAAGVMRVWCLCVTVPAT